MAQREDTGLPLRYTIMTEVDIVARVDKLAAALRELTQPQLEFMELGKGHWSARVKDLEGLRDQFFAHMNAYERIFSLRCLSKDSACWYYELVEIPKILLEESAGGKLSIRHRSRQNPKPGYCDVKDPRGGLKYQLYFDGGTERKLQIKNLRKDLCTVHATWIFATTPGQATEQVLGEPD
jgi:hypothetical protein